MASSVYPMQEKWIKLELSDWWEILIFHCLVFIPTHQEAETSDSYRMEFLEVCLEKNKNIFTYLLEGKEAVTGVTPSQWGSQEMCGP